MKNIRVLIAQKKDKTEFKIQEYKVINLKYTIDENKSVYKMLETDIIKDLNNNKYRTLSENTFTEVTSKYYESTKESHLVSIPNGKSTDNINNLSTY